MRKNNVNSIDKKRFGFILATVHAGSSQTVWESVAKRAQVSDCAFFVFPGGKLDKQSGSEFLRNNIYALANAHNLDGLISWTSSIGGAVSLPELDAFHKNFSSIPFVTIGQKIQGHPNVGFDAYSGMKKLVEHLIHQHAVRKIAFVRGPANHSSAEDRFRAYCDVIRENDPAGIDVRLVSSCCSWYEAEKAAFELFDERGLLPGKDFDAIVVASDLMASVIVDFLSRRGFSVPEDFLVAGFNDTIESRIATPQFSTVRMPQSEIGLEALEMLFKLFSGLEVNDKMLSTSPVIRESCGCNSIKKWTSDLMENEGALTKQNFRTELCRIFRVDVTSNEAKMKIDPLVSALFDKNNAEFFHIFNENLEAYFEKEGELSSLFDALFALRFSALFSEKWREDMFRSISVMIPMAQGRIVAKKRHKTIKINSEMSALKTELLSVHNRTELLRTLKKHLPALEINVCSVVLYGEDGESIYIGGFNVNVAENQDDEFREEKRFDSTFLVPKEYDEDFEKGVFVVQPLFLENQPYGYMIADWSGMEGSVYEDLRGAVSSALQNIFLFEELESAKIAAEQAEFEKTEFFAAIGSELCDPLKYLSSKISQMENNVNGGLLDCDILSEQLLFLRSQVEAQLEKTETLVDLTRSQVDNLPMDKRLFDIRQILPASVCAQINSDIPLLFGDPAVLKKAMDILFGHGRESRNPVVTPRVDGLHIHFLMENLDWTRPEFRLSEKIILLQYGEIVRNENEIDIVFPWPNLGGQPPAKFIQGKIVVRSISEEKGEIFGEKVLPATRESFDGAIEGEKTVFLWNPDDAPIDEWVKIYSFRRNGHFFRMPVICHSRMLIGHSFLEILEEKVKAQRNASVLFINASRTKFGQWATEANSVSISSMDDFERILAEITPSLIVFEEIDDEAISKIRQNRKTVLVPILVLPEEIVDENAVEKLCTHPRVILCNRGEAESEAFSQRVSEILSGGEILPTNTGALVKKAILYLNQNAPAQVVRWKLADTVHVSEDYLTRIFHREIGLSLWEYLNRFRICIATKLLLETNDSIYEIAERAGFQDQAYFCRVFKKIHGVSPGKIRQKK